MRDLGFIPFMFGQEKKVGKKKKKGDPQNIFVNSYKDVYKKTLQHNLDKQGRNERTLTSLAYANEVSSSVAMFISSRDHQYQWDLVLSDASDLKEYQGLGPDEWYRTGFKQVCGSDPKYDHLMELLEAEDEIDYD